MFSLVFSKPIRHEFGRIVTTVRLGPSARRNVYKNVIEVAVLDVGRLAFSKGDFRVRVDRVFETSYRPVARPCARYTPRYA